MPLRSSGTAVYNAAMFFSFDGIDGCGKTTQRGLFCQWLESQGHHALLCRDPGTTRLGEELRHILLQGEAPRSMMAEMLLYMAARAQLVAEVIEPALAAGQTVVCDRFLLANVVYQGYAGGLPVDELWHVGRLATRGIMPDQTFVLDVPVSVAQARLQRPLDKLESRGIDYWNALRAGYRTEAEKQPDRVVLIEANRSVDEVQRDICAAAKKVLEGRKVPL